VIIGVIMRVVKVGAVEDGKRLMGGGFARRSNPENPPWGKTGDRKGCKVGPSGGTPCREQFFRWLARPEQSSHNPVPWGNSPTINLHTERFWLLPPIHQVDHNSAGRILGPDPNYP
jgi:hypothetical protein